jgi:hypothetical protein
MTDSCACFCKLLCSSLITGIWRVGIKIDKRRSSSLLRLMFKLSVNKISKRFPQINGLRLCIDTSFKRS